MQICDIVGLRNSRSVSNYCANASMEQANMHTQSDTVMLILAHGYIYTLTYGHTHIQSAPEFAQGSFAGV